MNRERVCAALIVGAMVGVLVGALGSLALKLTGFSGDAQPLLIAVGVGLSTGILAGLLPRRAEDGEPR